MAVQKNEDGVFMEVSVEQLDRRFLRFLREIPNSATTDGYK